MSSDVQLDGFNMLLAGCEMRKQDDISALIEAGEIGETWQIKVPGYPYWRDCSIRGTENGTVIHISYAGAFRTYLQVWCAVNLIEYDPY